MFIMSSAAALLIKTIAYSWLSLLKTGSVDVLSFAASFAASASSDINTFSIAGFFWKRVKAIAAKIAAIISKINSPI